MCWACSLAESAGVYSGYTHSNSRWLCRDATQVTAQSGEAEGVCLPTHHVERLSVLRTTAAHMVHGGLSSREERSEKLTCCACWPEYYCTATRIVLSVLLQYRACVLTDHSACQHLIGDGVRVEGFNFTTLLVLWERKLKCRQTRGGCDDLQQRRGTLNRRTESIVSFGTASRLRLFVVPLDAPTHNSDRQVRHRSNHIGDNQSQQLVRRSTSVL